LGALSNKQILKEIEKIKVNEIPENLIQEEIKILTEGIKEEDVKKDKKKYENQAINRIKAGLILNAFGEENQIKVTEQELQAEIQKQLRMMPGQEKMIQEYYQNNPSLLANLKGSLYEEKIIKEIKLKAKPNKKEITKEQAEKLLKEENDKHLKEHSHHDHNHHKNDKKIVTPKKASVPKKTMSKAKKVQKAKKVSKK
jgi:trigger factor